MALASGYVQDPKTRVIQGIHLEPQLRIIGRAAAFAGVRSTQRGYQGRSKDLVINPGRKSDRRITRLGHTTIPLLKVKQSRSAHQWLRATPRSNRIIK